jgi:hypothetical protein
MLFNVITPDWNGNYKCILKSSFDHFAAGTSFEIHLKQDWDSICIAAETEFSSSHSLSGSFSINDSLCAVFTYEYINIPKNDSLDSMHIHKGIASIYLNKDLLQGEFYTGRGRNTYGVFTQIQ